MKPSFLYFYLLFESEKEGEGHLRPSPIPLQVQPLRSRQSLQDTFPGVVINSESYLAADENMAVAREFTDTEIIAEVSHNENDCSDDDDDVEWY